MAYYGNGAILMNLSRSFPSFTRRFSPLLLLLAFALSLIAQDAPSRTKNPAPVKAQKKISPKEMEEFSRSVDEILAFVSKDTGLPVRSAVKRRLASRDEVQRFVEERMAEDEDQKRLERAELVLKKFGLLPREFQLRPFLVALLKDQVAGFYDSKRKTVHLLDWIESDSQKPVLAHELTHALQDQSIDLDQWIKVARHAAGKSKDRETAEVELDEIISARTALLEGQGMAVLLDFILEPQGRSLKDSPQFAEALKVSMSSGNGSDAMSSAPLLLRESLIFPYRDGLGFVQALLQDGGPKRAFADALQQPPRNTREILSPESYLEKQLLPSITLPNLEPALGGNYRKYDIGSIGQFDIVLLAKQFSSHLDAKELPPSWRGGFYYSALKAYAAKKVAPTTNDLALLYVSQWSSPDAAQRFAALYAASFRLKYNAAVRERGQWRSEEGLMSVEVVGDQLLVMEGFDAKTAAQLRSAVLAPGRAEKSAPVKSGNLSLKTVSPIFALRLFLRH